ncbi:Crp/Fnr family transcriptional regulator [Flavivirga sp. 57AJ16]|uniref:Crp/Fnr family transcriptional regulator n=1 Tax=Flavivirga sp. 57AJ16 TaxID=3025307 RepID=UPI00236715A3|nr:Crp/Fnr family transcriptional regulator [Flavivirga sp. 57AJ16]MDD7886969.1 Crp/Fnr family transcriptional regulator [Flavivirga sp. 57AJ16]
MNKKKEIKTNKWHKLSHFFKQIEIPAKTTLLEEGKVSKNMFFIEKGCLRTWVNNKGKDITTQFFFEGNSVSSIESFRTNQPSLYSIESIEECIIHTISQKDFYIILDKSPSIKKEMEEHLFRRLAHYQQLLLSHLIETPQERYENLLKKKPEIIKRVPQHYIASYLGITSVSLSRIRNRR